MLQRPPRSATSLQIFVLVLATCFSLLPAQAQIGSPLPGLKPVETKFFKNGQKQFNRTWGLVEGVGPVFTDGGCQRCHKAPVLGGMSNRLLFFFGKNNPDGSFDPLLNEGGLLLQPISNSAFIQGGVCTLPGERTPPDANARENRMAAPVFGFGLIDAIDDNTIIAGSLIDQGDGIHGVVNTIPPNPLYAPAIPPNKIGRFGRKAQLANLVEMAAFAFAHDLGITNPLVPDEDLPSGQPIPPECTLNSAVPNNPNSGSGDKGIFPLSHFMRYLAPNKPGILDIHGQAGQVSFLTIGCSKCHTPSMQTPAAVRVPTDFAGTTLGSPALSNQNVGLYSDLLLHDMGTGLAGGIPAGQPNTQQATIQQWRTTPLWGLSLRSFYLHDGRTKDLTTAILNHSLNGDGEAAIVIGRFKALTPSDQSDLLVFLNSL